MRSVDEWRKILSYQEFEEAVYIHSTTALEGNTLTLQDCLEILYGDVQNVKDKYGITERDHYIFAQILKKTKKPTILRLELN